MAPVPQPRALPRWFGALVVRSAFRPKRETPRNPRFR